jgi:hypothetical protein
VGGGDFVNEQDPPGENPTFNPPQAPPVPPPPPPKMNSIEDIVRHKADIINWVLSKGKCRDKIGRYLTGAPPHQILLHDARDPSVQNIVYTRPPDPEDTIGQHFDRSGDAGFTVNRWEINRRGRRVNERSDIYFSAAFFSSDPANQGFTVVHELLHAILLAGEDGPENLGEKLGIPHNNIDDWIENGCQ